MLLQVPVDCLSGYGRMTAEGEALLEWMVKEERSWRRPALQARDAARRVLLDAPEPGIWGQAVRRPSRTRWARSADSSRMTVPSSSWIAGRAASPPVSSM